MRRLVRADLLVMQQRQRDIVEPFEQAFLRMRLDLEVCRPSELVGDLLRRQIDRQPVAVAALDRFENRVDLCRLEDYRQHPVLETIIVKNIRERRRDYRLEAEIHQRPYRMLARAAASKVFARHQYRRLLETRLLEHELAVRLMTPVVKKSRAETAAHHRLEKLLRDYLVGIDIGTIQRSDQAGEIFERLHFPVILLLAFAYSLRHYRAHQVRASALALPPLEVAVRRACASLARLQHVGVHRDTHAASRLAPFETGLRENLIEP